jgi:hypothetical protein
LTIEEQEEEEKEKEEKETNTNETERMAWRTGWEGTLKRIDNYDYYYFGFKLPVERTAQIYAAFTNKIMK